MQEASKRSDCTHQTAQPREEDTIKSHTQHTYLLGAHLTKWDPDACAWRKQAVSVGALVPIWCLLLLPSSPKHKDFLHEKSTREDTTLTATFDTTGSMQLGLWSLFGCAVWHVGERADSGAIPYNEAYRTQETGLLELLKWLTND